MRSLTADTLGVSVLLAILGLVAGCAEGDSSPSDSTGSVSLTVAVDSTAADQSAEPIRDNPATVNVLDDDPFFDGLGSSSLLPGVTGFDLLEEETTVGFAMSLPNAAQDLAAESVDREWARTMQEWIISEIPNATDASMNRVEVVCRTTWCGIAIEIPEGDDRGVRRVIADHIESTIGLPITGFPVINRSLFGFGRGDRPDWVAIYLRFER